MPARPHTPMSATTRARLGGLQTVARHGPDHMARVGRQGATALDRTIARLAGIPDDMPSEEYAARLSAARRAYYVRLGQRRWSAGPR